MEPIRQRYLLTEISRYLLPPILNTVKASTASACGKSARTSAKCFQAARLDMLCQCSSDSNASLCLLLNSVIATLLTILTHWRLPQYSGALGAALPPAMTAIPEPKARFIQEAKAASSLQRPNIVAIHEIGAQEGDNSWALCAPRLVGVR